MSNSRLRRIMAIALPITGGVLSQNIVNLVDIAFVKSLGDAALAASGLGGFAAFTAMALVIGLSTAVQAVVARRYGESRSEQGALSPLRAGLLLAVVSGVPLALLLYLAVPFVYPLFNQDPAVLELGPEYLQLRLLALPFVGINFAFRGYWNGIGRSQIYMLTLIFMNVVNAVLNYLLIFGAFGFPQLGLAGAGWGTTIAIASGSFVYVLMAWKRFDISFFRVALPSRAEFRSLLQLSVPAGLQQLLFASGFLFFHVIVGWIGTSELAACNILINLVLLAILPGMGFGMAASTLVGQALGRGQSSDAMRWGWQVASLGSLLVAVLVSLPMIALPELLLTPFAPGPEVLALAHWPLIVTGLSLPFDIFGFVLMYALLGAGDVKHVFFISTGLQWGLFLAVAVVAVSLFDVGLLGVWLLQSFYRLVQALVFAYSWQRGRWQDILV